MLAGVKRGRTFTLHTSDLKPCESSALSLPEMRLESTAAYFVNRLSPTDRALLASNLQALHSKCISIGTTCSGTDIIVPVFQQTFRALCKIFDVPWLELCTVQYSTVLYIQYSKVLYNFRWDFMYSTVQYCTVLYCTVSTVY